MTGPPTFTAVKGINLNIEDGEFMVLVGPSGRGKSTTLRTIAGLKESLGNDLNRRKGRQQSRTERTGIRDGLPELRAHPRDDHLQKTWVWPSIGKERRKEFIADTVGRTAKALQLDHMMERKPAALSGGQRQRVALGRAIVRNPKVFLFDEPLSNLDAKMRVQMRSEISRLHAQLGTTMVYVTHDQVEAMTMGDRICVMRDGIIMQVADPLTLYLRPENLFVAGFIGSPPMNLLKGKVQNGQGSLFSRKARKRTPSDFRLEGSLQTIASRCHRHHLRHSLENISSELEEGSITPISSTVDIAEPMGSESIVYMKVAKGSLIAPIPGEHRFHWVNR